MTDDYCKWTRVPNSYYYRKQCGGLVVLMCDKHPGLKCICGKPVI